MAQLFVSGRLRGMLQKFWALMLAISINLPALAGAITPTPAYAIAPTPTAIFSDGFESTSPFINWTSSDSKWSNTNIEHSGSKATKVTGDTQGIHNLVKATSTAGFSSINLSYWYRADDLEHLTCNSRGVCTHEDSVLVQYTIDGGANWDTLFTISDDNDDESYHQNSHTLPDSASNNPQFQIRFSADLNSGEDTVRIDDVLLTGIVSDTDDDGVADDVDNCDYVANPNQEDSDKDTAGDACDNTPYPPENTLDSCTNDEDDDRDEATDLSDTDCAAFKPTLVVVKQVEGGPLNAENFVLHVNDGDGFSGSSAGTTFTYDEPISYEVTEDAAGDYVPEFSESCAGELAIGSTATCTVTNFYDVCANREGYQTSVPSGYERNGDQCTEVVVVDRCEDTSSTVTVVSSPNNTTLEDGSPAVATWTHSAWNSASVSIPEATWVWETEQVIAPTTEQRASFFDVFTSLGDTTGATLTIAADNAYEVWVNNHYVGGDLGSTNFQSPDTIQIPIEMIQLGLNSIRIEVTNHASAGSTSETNPAGLLYKLVVTHNDCHAIEAPSCDPEANLIANGGFEAPNVLATEFGSTNGWDIIPDTNAALQWLVDWVTPQTGGTLGLEIQNNVAGAPHGVQQHAELDGDHPVSIMQSIPTIAGKEYTLKFWTSPRPGTSDGDNILRPILNTVALGADVNEGAGGGSTVWTEHTRTFTASGPLANLKFSDLGADNSLGIYLDDVSLTCREPIPTATIKAYKVVCDTESDLPNWSGTGRDITAETASAYVEASDGACRLEEGWQFQWAPTSATDPGDDFRGGASSEGGWHTFGPTDEDGMTEVDIPLTDGMSSVWVREVLKDGYIPFTYHSTNASTSAEFYCDGDVLNYDNLDYANGLADGVTQYCVAFNAPIPEEPKRSCDIEGYKQLDGQPLPGVTITAMTDPIVYPYEEGEEGQTGQNYVERKGTIHSTKTDSEGYYCFEDLPDGNYKLSEVQPRGTELDHMMIDEEGEPADIDSFFDVFTELGITQPSQLDSFFDVFTEFDGMAHHQVDSFFDIFTELNTAQPSPATLESFFDVFTELRIGGEGNETHDVNIYNETIVVVITPSNPGGGQAYTQGCTNPLATNFNPMANLDDSTCVLPPPPPTGGSGTTTETGGEVQGAAAEEIANELPAGCTEPYLLSYMFYGRTNDVEQVKKLQEFLNEHLGLSIPVTGFYGRMTRDAVKSFQRMYADDILAPWNAAGIPAPKDGTGHVYKTTIRKINLIKCADLDLPLPKLP